MPDTARSPRSVRLGHLFPHNNIGFGFSDDLEQFLLLGSGNLELVQGFLEFCSHDIPLFLANIQVRVGVLHRLSRVLARSGTDLANQLGDLKLEIGRRRIFSPGIDCRILVQRLVCDQPIDNSSDRVNSKYDQSQESGFK
jgi:hypothetical protein